MSESKSIISSSDQIEPIGLEQGEYEALETALLHTARGRVFLGEYLRRNGTEGVRELLPPSNVTGDTDLILRAVQNLHETIIKQHNKPDDEHLRMNILEMAKAISKTRAEISAIRADGADDPLAAASEEMDAIIQSTEKATNDILLAAEKIQEVAWRLREAGAAEDECEEIDNHATNIYMACSFQDITGQRTSKVIKVLQYLEARINSMIDIWGFSGEVEDVTPAEKSSAFKDERPDAHLLNGPQSEEDALEQNNIDALLGDDESAHEAMLPTDDVEDLLAGGFDEIETDEAPQAAPPQPELSAIPSEDQLDEALRIVEQSNVEDIDEDQLKALFS